MAAPPEITLKDVSGKWILNKPLSDSTDAILKMQGVPWLIRRVASFATVTLITKQYNTATQDAYNGNGNEVTHIDITQIVTGGVVTNESRILDWTLRDHKDHIFGDVKLKSRWVKLKNLKSSKENATDRSDDRNTNEAQAQAVAEEAKKENIDLDAVDEFLIKGWEEQEQEQQHVQTWGESERKGWIANQIWGFEVINEQRYYASHLELRKGDQRLLARLVYDYSGA